MGQSSRPPGDDPPLPGYREVAVVLERRVG